MPHDLPEYAVCARCPEYYRAALRQLDDVVLCANCADQDHPRHPCSICVRVLPCQGHHVGSKIVYLHFTTPLCLNCHRILNTRQFRWRRDGSAEEHPLRYLVQGVLDVVRLWLERSPVAEQCRGLFAMLAQAALYVLPWLRLEALVELQGLILWRTI